MKKLLKNPKKSITGAIAFFCFMLSLSISNPADAGLITLSQFSSDSTPADVLDATLDFLINGSVLELTVTNNTTDPFEYYIHQVFFNAFDPVENLTENDLPSGWSLLYDQQASPFGTFDYALVTDNGNNPDQIDPGESLLFKLDIAGTGPFSQSLFTTALSHDAPGDNPEMVAAAKFVRGPGDDSARGASPVPEPAAMLLFGTGLVGIAVFRKKRKK